MNHALLIRLRPLGPWRFGPDDGSRDNLDALYRSDRLYSALTHAMAQLGLLEDWLAATARAEKPAVRTSSMFPFQGDTLFVTPPRTVWPPTPTALSSASPVFLTKVRWKAARFVPVAAIERLLSGGTLLPEQWILDGESGCLLRRDRPQSSPFRQVDRTHAAVDRVTQSSAQPFSTACYEFEASSGLWTVVCFENADAENRWAEHVRAAFRLLADTGLGGGRSKGWGRSAEPEFVSGVWPQILMPELFKRTPVQTEAEDEEQTPLYWMLSLFTPAATDEIDWTAGDYRLTIREGRTESQSGWGFEKKQLRMITEGSVLAAKAAPNGTITDVAPDGFAHPVYRSGAAVTLRLPEIRPAAQVVEEATAVEATPESAEAAEEQAPPDPMQTLAANEAIAETFAEEQEIPEPEPEFPEPPPTPKPEQPVPDEPKPEQPGPTEPEPEAPAPKAPEPESPATEPEPKQRKAESKEPDYEI